jgi:hypothetical protein
MEVTFHYASAELLIFLAMSNKLNMNPLNSPQCTLQGFAEETNIM